MSSRTRSRWGIVLTILVTLLVGFTSAAWMPVFAAQETTGSTGPSISPWFGTRIGLRSSEELARNEAFDEQKNKKMGLEVRYDSTTGNVIYTLTESGAIASAPAPLSNVLRTCKSANGIHAYRFNSYTGEVWVWEAGDAWKQAAPPSNQGIYDLVLTPFGDEGKINVLRIEQTKGETWWINAEGGPKKLAEPPKAG